MNRRLQNRRAQETRRQFRHAARHLQELVPIQILLALPPRRRPTRLRAIPHLPHQPTLHVSPKLARGALKRLIALLAGAADLAHLRLRLLALRRRLEDHGAAGELGGAVAICTRPDPAAHLDAQRARGLLFGERVLDVHEGAAHHLRPAAVHARAVLARRRRLAGRVRQGALAQDLLYERAAVVVEVVFDGRGPCEAVAGARPAAGGGRLCR